MNKLKMVCLMLAFCVSSLFAMENEEKSKEAATVLTTIKRATQEGTLLSLHGININDYHTWPHKSFVDSKGATYHSLHFTVDYDKQEYSLYLQGSTNPAEQVVEASKTILAEDGFNPNQVSHVNGTYIVNHQPYFIKLAIANDKIIVKRISSPLPIYLASIAKKCSVQNGIDNNVYGIIENRGSGTIFLGSQQDVRLEYGEDGCIFKPEHPGLTSFPLLNFNNVNGAIYARQGVVIVSAINSIDNGHGLEVNSLKDIGGATYLYKYIENGNGSFILGKEVLLNSNYIRSLYNNITALDGRMIMQGNPKAGVIEIKGGMIEMTQDWWVQGQRLDLRQDREEFRILQRSESGISFSQGAIARGPYPKVRMQGGSFRFQLEMVCINHHTHRWQPEILEGVGSGQEYRYTEGEQNPTQVPQSGPFDFINLFKSNTPIYQ